MERRYLDSYIPLVDAIAETFGKNCEVVLHDLSRPEQSIIKIANGHLTGRDVGSSATDFVLSLLGKRNLKKDYFVGYPTKTKKGVELKSTTVFIRDRKKRVIGALCKGSAKRVSKELSVSLPTIYKYLEEIQEI